MFGGDAKDDPKTIIDTTIEDSMADYNITSVSITRGTKSIKMLTQLEVFEKDLLCCDMIKCLFIYRGYL